MEVLYEDNHLIIVNKAAGEIVQGDKTGDATPSKPILKRSITSPAKSFSAPSIAWIVP